MWHETRKEMVQIIKSLVRLDHSQKKAESEATQTEDQDCDNFWFEAHIVFDDAFEADSADSTQKFLNDYVNNLKEVIPEAAKRETEDLGCENNNTVPHTDTALQRVIVTPYGGRLKWNLPFGNSLFVHLKNKALIRKGKRWSQVMYMYYLLSHTLLRRLDKSTVDRARNTFLLALDGDVDFQPEALRRLIQRFRTGHNIGAACGRIHPNGSGCMVSYQKFEYAISHWLQKATEHVLGCVLCSPGCFSLFRAYALMDDNVLKKYTTVSTEARHCVQYDQGEDRWLCTLLLQQGYRVEYCAASDSYTNAPAGFYEFCKQRRRWIPSTFANILDLLQNWNDITRKNDDISFGYIIYQAYLLFCAVITPGTIFLVLAGALSAAYPSIPLIGSVVINFIPIAIFLTVCFFGSQQNQLRCLAFLSAMYALLMMMVLAGMVRTATDFGICSITTVLTIIVVVVFISAAILHWQEKWCVLPALVYYLAVPSMSMLLIFYSIVNLHVVSWGTREAAKPRTEQQEDQGVYDAFVECVEDGCTADELSGMSAWKDAAEEALEDLGFDCSFATRTVSTPLLLIIAVAMATLRHFL
nr:hypothetical protein BaRGS_009725 [Batillaria attramentaria]